MHQGRTVTAEQNLPVSLHVIGSKALGGAERFGLRLVAALAEHGAPVKMLLREGSEVMPHTPAGVKAGTSPMRTVWDPFSRWAVSKAIKQIKPDIVQTYMGRATRLTHMPHGKDTVHIARLGGYYKLDGYRHAHAWIGNTQGVCDYMIRGGLPAQRIFHISNFIDLPQLQPNAEIDHLRDTLVIPRDALVLATAGRFVPVKGQAYLLEAFARLPATLHDRPLWLLMVGDGVLGEALRAQARQLGIDTRISWTGWQTDPAPYYQMADLVVFPSLEEETLGNVILDAWAHQKPLVTASFRGAREISKHGVDAWQVPCADAVALAEGIRTVLTDDALAQAIAREGRARVQRDFTRTEVVRKYLDLYNSLLSGAR